MGRFVCCPPQTPHRTLFEIGWTAAAEWPNSLFAALLLGAFPAIELPLLGAFGPWTKKKETKMDFAFLWHSLAFSPRLRAGSPSGQLAVHRRPFRSGQPALGEGASGTPLADEGFRE
ncbi:hypothetical protein TraAM80_09625 [Trypanosoma rangeli]|uniref:Uncharacterized protein n=1 Tax=Trypanosoma rangeli TaxID=5698 RepID=A0A422MUP0_TRYRA|nr:uncharacterized protein TraAM80_09625 [Trypanosoma rangeli]RNE96917.1 hypothetical protein TraAM80_09625 [Trypanosoma rangeli]|eukprot:RNE96917.1 hypothetical protein TraAM80_09625 [Trypanosoma rangeli]